MSARSAVASYAALSAAIVLWGSGFVPTEWALESASSTTVNVLRAVPAALLLVGWTLWKRRSTRLRISGATLASGVLMIGAFTAAISEGTARAGAANTAVLLNTHPFWVLLLASALLGERVPRASMAGVAVGFVGVVAVVAPQLGTPAGGDSFALGLAVALVGAVAWAAGTVIVRRAATRAAEFDVVDATTGQYAAGAVFLVVIALPDGVEANWASSSLWLATAWLAVGTSVLATLSFLYCLRRIGAVEASTWQFLVPVVAIAIDVGRGKAPSPMVLGGMLLTIVGVALVSGAPRLRTDTQEEVSPRTA